MTHGEWFRSKREAAGLTQRQVADALGWKSSQYISNWERNVAYPPPHRLKDLADILKVEYSMLRDVVNESVIERRDKYFERRLEGFLND